MDPRQKRKANKRVEIVREGGSMRKMRLSDIMSESFSKYLMGLDGDFIAPTGDRLSDLLEAPTDAQIRARAGEIWKNKGSPQQPGEQMRADYLNAKTELEDEEELVNVRNALSPTNPDNEAGRLGLQDQIAAAQPQPEVPQGPPAPTVQPPAGPLTQGLSMLPAVEDEEDAVIQPPATKPGAPPPVPQPPTDPDNDVDHELGGGDSSTVDVPERPEGGPEVFEPTNPPVKPEYATGAVDVAGDSPDDSSKELGGPDEFDEKNKPFTAQMDALITGMASDAAAGSPADVYSVSERALRRGRSLVEAVYGPRTLVIDRR